MQNLLILPIRLSHFLILGFVVFGWLFNSQSVLLVHLILVPLIILQWKLNSGRCLLTDLEHKLLKKPLIAENHESEGFVKNILKRFCHKLPSDQQILCLMYGVMSLSIVLSLIKIL